MRAKEFTINVPITISISGDNDPVVSTGNQTPQDDTELQQNPVMVSPLQQDIELKKAAIGKNSPVIDKLTQDHSVGEEPTEENDIIKQLRSLMSR